MSEAPCCALGHRGDQMCKVPAVTEPTLQCRGEGWVTVNKYTHPVAGGDAFKKKSSRPRAQWAMGMAVETVFDIVTGRR